MLCAFRFFVSFGFICVLLRGPGPGGSGTPVAGGSQRGVGADALDERKSVQNMFSSVGRASGSGSSRLLGSVIA